MRDIRPSNKSRPGLPMPDPVPALPPGKPLRKAGATPVPVSHITVPPAAAARPRPAAPAANPAKRHWHIGRRERMIIAVLLTLALITGGLAAAIFLPTANIVLVLRTAPLLVDESLTLTSDPAEASNAIPGTSFFREVQVDGQAPVTSTQVVGKKSIGTVDIVNRSTEEQKIKTQSRLVTGDDVLFYMQESVTLPPGPSRVAVTVEAAEAGEAGNIEPQRLDFAALDTASRSLVYAEAASVFTGGAGEAVPIVRESDITAAQAAAGQEARAQVEQDIRGELPAGWSLLDESWAWEMASFETPIALDAQEATIPYTARVVIRVMGFETAALEAHLRAALEARMDENYMLFPGPISFSKSVKNVVWEDGTAEISARVTHTTIPQFSLESLREKILGRSEAEAKQYLEGLPGVRQVQLALWPFWVTSIPRIESRVMVDLQPERQP